MSDLPYDPDARRDTPLALKLKARIKARGPLSVREYMIACLQDPEHGYYQTKPAIGRTADFITAPEISQAFGELIGLWAAVVWQQMGSPDRFNFIELGPGRGTLIADALRATRIVPGFLEAAEIALIETNETLRAEQRACLSVVKGSAGSLDWFNWTDEIWWDDPEPGKQPTIVIGNEFLDTLAVDQFIRRGVGWERVWIGLDDADRLILTGPRAFDGLDTSQPLAHPELDERFATAGDGETVTVSEYGLVDEIISPWPTFAALLIDYGHPEAAAGDTLQAVRNHAYEHPLTSPGEADLTAQVDFSAVARRALRHQDDLAIDGPVTQGEFLGSLGIAERASRLMAANPDKAAEIEAGIARLMAVPGMGDRFKAIGIRSADLSPLPGFERLPTRGRR